MDRLHRGRSLVAGIACAAGLAACNTDALPGSSVTDMERVDADGAAAGDDASIPPDMDDFCGSRSSPRIELNGMLAARPAVSAHPLFLDCCEAATIDFVSMQIATPITVMWRHQGGLIPESSVTLDLARLPKEWSVAVYSGCNPTQPPCTPTDHFESGLSGTLLVSHSTPAQYSMSLCLALSDPAGQHPVIHSLRMWTPPVSTP